MSGDVRAELAVLSQSLTAQGRIGPDAGLALALDGVATALQALNEAGQNLARPYGWWGRLSGRPLPIPNYLQALDLAALAVDGLAEALRAEEGRLAATHRSLEALQRRAGALAEDLEAEIAAGEAQLVGLEAAAADDRAPRDDLERRLHDLHLTRRVLEETAFSIASLLDANDLLTRRVKGMLEGVLPTWENQTAQLLGLARAAPGQGLPPAEIERLQEGSADLLAAVSKARTGRDGEA